MLLEHALLYIAVPIISFSLLVYIFYILKRRHRSSMNVGYPYPPQQQEPDLSRYYNMHYLDECYPPNFIVPPTEPPPPYPGLEKGPPPLDPITYHRDDVIC
ncbi:Protein CBG06577 [Caenorhabditis briggsae]|uniref:Protein CBG06577 n=1 Tax=Caenorhabditis briggsae TaxID=6238 RepID=A8X2K6_CAEBR|nr:Protein CBG06577 [Caenorhabditis briggsae]CAP26866.2 Protein CBG06577 [Caenorhabditis briggsae]